MLYGTTSIYLKNCTVCFKYSNEYLVAMILTGVKFSRQSRPLIKVYITSAKILGSAG